MRIITSGRGVTTNAVPPTGRFINLVITAGRDGNLDVYVDGARIGGGTLPDLGINGCAPAELRFGADQGGGQRISAELDRTAMFTTVLSATDRARWQELAFIDGDVSQQVPVGGTVPRCSRSRSRRERQPRHVHAGRDEGLHGDVAATVTTSAPDAALSVRDPSATAAGHLVNGTLRDAAGPAGPGRRGAFAPSARRTDALGPRRPGARPVHARVQAAGRGHGLAPHRRVRQDADVHAVSHDAIRYGGRRLVRAGALRP